MLLGDGMDQGLKGIRAKRGRPSPYSLNYDKITYPPVPFLSPGPSSDLGSPPTDSECNQALIESMALHSGELSFVNFSRTHFVLNPSSSNSTISRAPPIITGTWSRSIMPTRLSTHIFDCLANMPKFIPQPSSSPSDYYDAGNATTTRVLSYTYPSSCSDVVAKTDEFISQKPLNSVGMEHEFYNCYGCRFYKVFDRRCLLDPRYEK
ncbi:hypothetical protein ALC57_17537 [Trachymyrmex cornetzi]|uniref:Uncharacterized protein n=1 Tax=Trachymyrmex cornetzi TaxID=471704 RepID=A0A195DBQ4_9HYME|nr:hypothetical protein ALC57_17537 [Trachymyrmex cornetzi]